MGYCTYCGKPLRDGELCTCPKALQKRGVIPNNAPATKKKSMPLIILLCVIGGIAVSLLIGVLAYKSINNTVRPVNAAVTESFDPFEGVEVVFTGTSPFAQVEEITFANKTNAMSDLTYTIPNAVDLRAGSTTTLLVQAPNGSDLDQYCTKHFHMVPTRSEIEVEIKDVDKYIESLDELPEEAMNEAKSHAEDAIKSYTAGNVYWDPSKMSMTNLSYAGAYLLSGKDGMVKSSDIDNYLYLLYHVEGQIAGDEANPGNIPFDFYYPVWYRQIILDKNGDCTHDWTKYETLNVATNPYHVSGPTGANHVEKNYPLPGYHTLDDAYAAIVSSNAEKYECDTDITEAVPASDMEVSSDMEVDTAWVDAYKAFLSNPESYQELLDQAYLSGIDTGNAHVGLEDLNNDGIPELLLDPGEADYTVCVYSYQNGNIAFIIRTNHGESILDCENTPYFTTIKDSSDSWYQNVYTIDDGTLVTSASTSRPQWMEYTMDGTISEADAINSQIYQLDGENTDKATFDNAVQSMLGGTVDGSGTGITMYPITNMDELISKWGA